MAEPTPGPWRANLYHTKRSAGRTYGFIIAADDTAPIAAVTLSVEGMPDDVGRANAKLIAAAPDLYAALADLIEEIEADGGVDTSAWPILDAGKAALAKARGVSP